VAPEQGRGGSPAGSSPDRDGARAEQQLLLLLLAGASWRERARDIVPAEWFESAEYREIYGALLGRRSEDPVALTETLSPAALPVWAELQASAAQLGGQQLDQIYEGACQTLEARPHFRALEALSQRMRVATPDEQTALADEKQRRLQELKDRYPQAWQQRSGWRRLRSGARRGGPRA